MPPSKRVTAESLRAKKRSGQKITMLTAYDYTMARLLDAAGVDALLVGDSLGMTVLGYDTTIPVTLQDILHHTSAVVRGTQRALVVADLPFLTYQVSLEEALRNAGRLIQEGGAQAVKLEGGRTVAPAVQRIVEAGIPVMGHLGLTPQSIHRFGGYRVQGKTRRSAEALLEDARALERAGVFAIVLELVPAELARLITEEVGVPTIGIGAGPYCDGQVQVINDILGLDPEFQPRHAKQYAPLGEQIQQIARRYVAEVQEGLFPEDAHSTHIDPQVLEGLGRVSAPHEAGQEERAMVS
jgi:3-methyl-2-oxobutanoate hydroxymethyltransferase